MISAVGFWILSALLGLVAIALSIVWVRLGRPGSDRLETMIREELRRVREDSENQSRALRKEVADNQKTATESLVNTLSQMGQDQKQSLELLRKTLDERLRELLADQQEYLRGVINAMSSLEKRHLEQQEKARETLETKFKEILKSNEEKLEQMRQTVDEKLHSTLEKRLGESFKLVSERLEAVQRGLGEMQTLATGVGDLKRVLTNVKERGTWGEYQLASILEDILTPEQYGRNVQIKEGSREAVEFAVKLPGRDDRKEPVWLPIDSKFPKEPYERLLNSSQRGDAEGVAGASADLVKEVKKMAGDIREKYIDPPNTTDFAILFLPTEGLYAELLRQPGLHDEIQRKFRVLLAGPTTLAAILNSLRIGFQTLAIQKRTSEVWELLRAVKSDFGRFGEVLDKVKKQVVTVSNTLDETSTRARAIERKLGSVEKLPGEQADKLLQLPETGQEA